LKCPSNKAGSKKGIQPHHAAKLQMLMAELDNAIGSEDMNAPNWRLHELSEAAWPGTGPSGSMAAGD